jgi:hypothetical protein
MFRWFANALSVAIQNRLSGGGLIPRPFANLHIRYGEKALEMVPVFYPAVFDGLC